MPNQFQKFLPTHGFGQDGFDVDEHGAVFKFAVPSSKAWVVNGGNDPVIVGVNMDFSKDLTGVNRIDNGSLGRPHGSKETAEFASKQDARDQGIHLEPGEGVTFEGLIDEMSGRRKIINVWAICANTNSTKVRGGSLGS
jgi:hypothetical protein